MSQNENPVSAFWMGMSGRAMLRVSQQQDFGPLFSTEIEYTR